MTHKFNPKFEDTLTQLSDKFHAESSSVPDTLWPAIVSEIKKKEESAHNVIWQFFQIKPSKLVASMACMVLMVGVSSFISLKHAEDQAISFIMDNMIDESSVTLLLDVYDE